MTNKEYTMAIPDPQFSFILEALKKKIGMFHRPVSTLSANRSDAQSFSSKKCKLLFGLRETSQKIAHILFVLNVSPNSGSARDFSKPNWSSALQISMWGT
jgi:hypothetical protein